MFVTQPPGLVPSEENPEELPAVPSGQVWSMTSTFVPYKRLNLAAYVSVDSDATSRHLRPDPGHRRHRRAAAGARARSPTACSPTPTVSERLAEFNRSGNSLTYGNLLTVPLGDELMYVEPVYARRATASEANFPILRYVLVSYKGGVGLATTLRARSRRRSPTSSEPDGDADRRADRRAHGDADRRAYRRAHRRHRRVRAPSRTCSHQAQQEFALADEALTAGDLSAYQEHIQKARDLVRQALDAEGGGSSSPSDEPSASGDPSPEHPDLGRHRPCRNLGFTDAGWSSSVARWAHNPEVAGSNPAPATKRNTRSEAVFGEIRRRPLAVPDRPCGQLVGRPCRGKVSVRQAWT